MVPSSLMTRLLLGGALAGPGPEPGAPLTPADANSSEAVDPTQIEAELEAEVEEPLVIDPIVRAENNYRKALELSQTGQHHEASTYVELAYSLLPPEEKFGDMGLIMLTLAADIHLRAFSKTRDATRLAVIQERLEEFLVRHRGIGAPVTALRHKLDLVRSERLGVAEILLQHKKHVEAAEEARRCYETIQLIDQGERFGERAVLLAADAYSRAWFADNDVRHIQAALALVDDHLRKADDAASPRVRRTRNKLAARQELARASGGAVTDEYDPDVRVVSERDRSHLFSSGAALGGGIGLAVGSSVVGSLAFSYDGAPDPGLVGTAVPLSLVGGTVTGLAIYSMVRSGFVPPRARKITAATGTVVGFAGLVTGTALLAVGSAKERRAVQGAGLGLMLGMSAPLGTGISALVSRARSR